MAIFTANAFDAGVLMGQACYELSIMQSAMGQLSRVAADLQGLQNNGIANASLNPTSIQTHNDAVVLREILLTHR